jgi:hypothetical protein
VNAAALLAAIDAHVASVDGEHAVLRGGGALDWSARDDGSIESLWVYLDDDAVTQNDHNLCFGDDAGPPEGDAELERTPYAGAAVRWFLLELPWDRYWFVADDGVHAWDFDGGLQDVLPAATAVDDVLIARIVARLADR